MYYLICYAPPLPPSMKSEPLVFCCLTIVVKYIRTCLTSVWDLYPASWYVHSTITSLAAFISSVGSMGRVDYFLFIETDTVQKRMFYHLILQIIDKSKTHCKRGKFYCNFFSGISWAGYINKYCLKLERSTGKCKCYTSVTYFSVLDVKTA